SDGTGHRRRAARTRPDCLHRTALQRNASRPRLSLPHLRGKRVKRGLMAAIAIAQKDLRTEWRTKESLNSSVSFALVILVLFSFAFDLDREEKLALSGGLLWLVYAFAGALIVNRSFAR